MAPFEVVFGRKLSGPEDFVRIFMQFSYPHDDPIMNGIFWAVDDLKTGVFYLTNIYQHEADAHFTFFDRRIDNKKQLVRKMVQLTMDHFGFRRLNITIPKYVNAKVHQFVIECGGIYEGKKLASAQWKDAWYDESRYAMINKKLLTSGG
jgi:hypothetical protein